MHIINPNIHLDRFFEELSTARSSYLFLDFDGTLAPFHNDPTKVTLYPGVIEHLEAIAAQTTTNLCLISGRGLESLLERLSAVIPNLQFKEIWASHGAEQRTFDKKYWHLPLAANQIQGLESAKLIAKTLPQGAFCEQKPLSLAIHWRAIEDEGIRKQVEQLVLQQWSPFLEHSGLALHFFNGGIEIRPKEMSKAYAVKNFLSKISPESRPPIAYLGDDATDEEAFVALGNHGLKVLVNKNLPETTHADLQLTPPNELLDFLNRWSLNTNPKIL